MSEHEKKALSETAARHLADWQTPERQALVQRVMYGDPSVDDLIAISQAELREALDSLPPSAPDNGRHVDGFHAGCCALRVTAYLSQIEQKLKNAPPRQLVPNFTKEEWRERLDREGDSPIAAGKLPSDESR